MTEFGDDLKLSLSHIIDEGVNFDMAKVVKLPEVQKRVSSRLVQWLVFETRKSLVADLDARLSRMTVLIDQLSSELVLTLEDGKVRVDAVTGKSKDTLSLLVYGSDWFVGHTDIANAIADAVFNE